ncbi:uncharacterized membrane protein YjjP (DUF1212 family) [Luteibacter sp. Sphag1AF]|uniref:DUF3649 domain-containing protein n=1 Tax=Luteibacter sp. Sphag1AF TaxID=2587031 RepID=UPI0016122AD0|nr:DUF3649 domain-containing protein [Luteibacter sp. Sphag1AF]MBB3228082.1 uncharacterized membrane protein YjjP (DUF1212 family) [Luteibacter sp. Sphag1AF]
MVSRTRIWPGVASRAVAAMVGGYALAAAFSAFVAVLPGNRAELTMTGLLLSFAVYACAVIWVFAARTAWRAWLGLIVPGACLALGLWLLLPGNPA